jgi:cation diffusion facilitator CzcD-associated flavoprotein CzcO
VPSHFYSYSFAPNPNWSRKFSLQPEIHQYFISVANQYEIRPHVRFHSTLKSAEYEPEPATWKVIIEDQRKVLIQKRCKILISAVGALSIPKQCDIPGAERFKGHLFHSAKWDHSFDYKNKEVICIGIDIPRQN